MTIAFPDSDKPSEETYLVEKGINPRERAIGFLISIAFYILLFSNTETFALPVQLASISLLFMSFLIVITGNIKLHRISFYEFSVLACCMISIPAASYIGSEVAPQAVGYIILFSFLTFSVVGMIGVICSNVSLETVMQSAARAYIAMILTVATFFSNEFLTALNPNASDRWALRVRAFNLHPNLEGWIFAGGAIILLGQALLSQGVKRIIFIIFSVMSFMIVLSASARASLLAAIIAGIILLFVSFPKLPRTFQRGIFSCAVLFVLLCAAFAERIWGYLYEVLELGSNTRGIESGGSGRTELWDKGIDLFGSSVGQTLLGGGMRWSSADNIGFSVESSYITILLDSGLIFGTLLILSMVFSLIRSLYWILFRNSANIFDIIISYIIVFSFIQSVFNRYILSIGNTFSLLLIFIFTYASRGYLKKRTLLQMSESNYFVSANGTHLERGTLLRK